MVGALGLNNPSDLKPSHIMRRIGVDEVKSFDQIYTYVKLGQFLQGDIPDDYRIHWEYADPDKF